MPRKRWRARLSSYVVPKMDPNDRNAIEDHDLVRHALVDFEELGVLSPKTREQLVEDLVDSIRFARGGVNAGKRGMSNQSLSQQIFLSDVGRALERAGLPAKRWRKQYDNGGDESFFFRLAREVADVSDIPLPQDLKLPGQRAAQHRYGMMSPAMKVAQENELAAPQDPDLPSQQAAQHGYGIVSPVTEVAQENEPAARRKRRRKS
jgi:hypothetical protein